MEFVDVVGACESAAVRSAQFVDHALVLGQFVCSGKVAERPTHFSEGADSGSRAIFGVFKEVFQNSSHAILGETAAGDVGLIFSQNLKLLGGLGQVHATIFELGAQIRVLPFWKDAEDVLTLLQSLLKIGEENGFELSGRIVEAADVVHAFKGAGTDSDGVFAHEVYSIKNPES